MLVFRVPGPIVAVFAAFAVSEAAFVAAVCVVVVAAAAAVVVAVVASGEDTAAQLPVGTSLVKTCTLTTQALTKLPQVSAAALEEVAQPIPVLMLSPVNKLWFAT